MSESGICAIKPEFIIKDHTRTVALENNSESEPLSKKQRLSKSEKKKLRGQNKCRPLPFKIDKDTQLCPTLINVLENEERKQCTNQNCKLIHDVQEYLKVKPKDIGDFCYNYNTNGRCIRGVTCRFSSAHITPDGFNKIDPNKYSENQPLKTQNHITSELLFSLRKRTYDFSPIQKIIEKDDEWKKANQNGSNSNTEQKETSGVVTDEDIIRLRKCEKKTIDWKGKLYLSPLTTVGNLPFRRICKEYGADITCGEMAMSTSLLQGMPQEWALVKRHESEDIFGVQLCGNNTYTIGKTAQLLQDNMNIDFIDINLGCPIDLVYREGGGSGMLRRQHILGSVIRCTSELLNIPLTVKTRMGVYANENIAHTLLPKFRDWGVSMVTLHGRSREQRFTKLADWSYINECANVASPLTVFGNGDILNYEDYAKVQENYKNISGVMIGRGALMKPWIFTEIKEQKLWDISSSERFEILKKYTNYGLEHWGSDMKGVENTRRFMLEWLSFLYRYVPVGLLEHPPQKINERPPTFRGRDELETLMASACCSDWIKISEMLLGPVPENFHFLPKHKANSYQ